MSLRVLTSSAQDRLDHTLEKLEGARVGLLGLGVAGKAMGRYLLDRGAYVVAADAASGWTDPGFEAALKGRGELKLGPVTGDVFVDVEVLVVSPGVDPRQEGVLAVEESGRPVIGELELLGNLSAKVVGITGTNGKSTTTALLGEILEASGEACFIGGNLGTPVSTWVNEGAAGDVAVLELSSYQLETAYRFSPEVAVILNVMPDHAERYESHREYILAKRGLIEQMAPEGVAILNYDDPVVKEMASATRAQVWWFSVRGPIDQRDGVYVEKGTLRGSGRFASYEPVSLRHPRLFGTHNEQNALAAFLSAAALGLDATGSWDSILKGYQGFKGLPHRLELVGMWDGVRFINDSKATNDSAAAVAVTAINRPMILLVGGKSKGAGYKELLLASVNKVRHVAAFGAACEEVAEAFFEGKEEVGAGVSRCGDLRNAFLEATFFALPGDVVLLAPACASFDEFSSYEERGRVFKELVDQYGRGLLQ